MKVIVYHSGYGCGSGCCGHVVIFPETNEEEFFFTHPYRDDYREFAEDLVRKEFGEEHVKDLAWDECVISDD